MSEEKAKCDAEIVKSLKELFTEYVTLQRLVNDNFYEFKIPWHAIYQIESYTTNPERYAERQANKQKCCDIWWNDVTGNHKDAFLETPQEVEDKITAARDKTLSAIKKHRMLII